MATTTFSGPIKAGTVREGGSANVGFVEMAQSAAWSQSTSSTSTGIIIPANSQITEITLYINTAPATGTPFCWDFRNCQRTVLSIGSRNFC